MKHTLKKYSIILLSAIILERCSTMYITAVSDKEIAMMMLFAFVGPIIHLPFIGFMIDETSWKGRIFDAIVYGLGYAIGSYLTFVL